MPIAIPLSYGRSTPTPTLTDTHPPLHCPPSQQQRSLSPRCCARRCVVSPHIIIGSKRRHARHGALVGNGVGSLEGQGVRARCMLCSHPRQYTITHCVLYILSMRAVDF